MNHRNPAPFAVDDGRRDALKFGGGMAALAAALAAGLVTPDLAIAQEWNKAAFDSRSLADTAKALGAATPAESKDIQLQAPDIAENGAVVPITITSNIPKTQNISVLIEKNRIPWRQVSTFRKAPTPTCRRG